MMNRIYRTEEDENPVVHIIGKLDSATTLDEFLAEIVNYYKKESKNPEKCCQIVLDMKETELITDTCLEILKKYSKSCSVKFQNISLYVELLLNENGLLEQKINN
jgi:predicted house-cleaning noncanonical NTP pyrophosphatase (MazG superfamily)